MWTDQPARCPGDSSRGSTPTRYDDDRHDRGVLLRLGRARGPQGDAAAGRKKYRYRSTALIRVARLYRQRLR